MCKSSINLVSLSLRKSLTKSGSLFMVYPIYIVFVNIKTKVK